MGKFWKIEKSNHHFPELKRTAPWLGLVARIVNVQRLAGIVSVLAVGVGMVFLLQTNITATQGYQIKDLERHVSELRDQNKKLHLQAVELQSMSHVIDETRTSDLVVSDRIDIIVPGQTNVARR